MQAFASLPFYVGLQANITNLKTINLAQVMMQQQYAAAPSALGWKKSAFPSTSAEHQNNIAPIIGYRINQYFDVELQFFDFNKVDNNESADIYLYDQPDFKSLYNITTASEVSGHQINALVDFKYPIIKNALYLALQLGLGFSKQTMEVTMLRNYQTSMATHWLPTFVLNQTQQNHSPFVGIKLAYQLPFYHPISLVVNWQHYMSQMKKDSFTIPVGDDSTPIAASSKQVSYIALRNFDTYRIGLNYQF
jgi:hypothetical protein